MRKTILHSRWGIGIGTQWSLRRDRGMEYAKILLPIIGFTFSSIYTHTHTRTHSLTHTAALVFFFLCCLAVAFLQPLSSLCWPYWVLRCVGVDQWPWRRLQLWVRLRRRRERHPSRRRRHCHRVRFAREHSYRETTDRCTTVVNCSVVPPLRHKQKKCPKKNSICKKHSKRNIRLTKSSNKISSKNTARTVPCIDTKRAVPNYFRFRSTMTIKSLGLPCERHRKIAPGCHTSLNIPFSVAVANTLPRIRSCTYSREVCKPSWTRSRIPIGLATSWQVKTSKIFTI